MNRRTIEHLRRYGPWAVVTGATSGIGREAALHLGRAGLSVALVARRAERLDELAAELEGMGVSARVIQQDLAAPGGPASVLASTEDLDVGLLVASAGFGSAGPFLDQDPSEEAEMIDVNARALMLLTHGFGRRFVQRGRGGLALMSSIVAFQGVPNAANYAATKAYVQSLAEGLRLELGPLGVDVVASAPGPVHSGFAARAAMTMDQAVDPALVARGTLEALGRRGTVRPGALSKLLGGALSTLPRAARVRVMANAMRGMADAVRTR